LFPILTAIGLFPARSLKKQEEEFLRCHDPLYVPETSNVVVNTGMSTMEKDSIFEGRSSVRVCCSS
jgi:hypothetical protein